MLIMEAICKRALNITSGQRKWKTVFTLNVFRGKDEIIISYLFNPEKLEKI